jgi:hypothetical protein
MEDSMRKLIFPETLCEKGSNSVDNDGLFWANIISTILYLKAPK